MEYWNKMIVEPVTRMWNQISDFVPTLIGGLLILLVGLIVARIIRGLIQKLLDLIRFDTMTEKTGIDKGLTQGGIKTKSSQILSGLVYWVAVIMVLIMTLGALGITKDSTTLLNQLTGYLGGVIIAIFVLVLGMFLGVLVSGVVTTAASNAKIPQAGLLGGISKYAIIVFAFVIALDKLKIGNLPPTVFLVLFGAICLTLALAFGLGCKDLAAKYIEDLLKKRSKE